MSETTITLRLPGDQLLGTATIHIKRGNEDVIGSFEYKTLADIAAAIGEHLDELHEFDMPNIKLTDEDEWDPELEKRRAQLTVGTWVKTPDGIGCITTTKDDPPKDEVWVDIDGLDEPGSYPLITLVKTEEPTGDGEPASTPAAGDLSTITDTVQSKLVAPSEDDSAAQLSLF